MVSDSTELSSFNGKEDKIVPGFSIVILIFSFSPISIILSEESPRLIN